MKYIVSTTTRAGASGKENEASIARVLGMLLQWKPPDSMTIHHWFSRLDGGGGFAVVETDDPAALMATSSKFAPYFDFQIVPVIDFAESVPAWQEGVEFRASID